MKKILKFIILSTLLYISCKKQESYDTPSAKQESLSITTSNISSVITVSSNGFINIPVNTFGYNTRFPGLSEPWDLSKIYTPGFKSSAAGIVRYPGGTVANYWDFSSGKLLRRKNTANASGWVDLQYIDPSNVVYDIIAADTTKQNTVTDLKNVVDQTGCSIAFVMNMITPGEDYYEASVANGGAGWANIDRSAGSAGWYEMLDNRYTRFKGMLNRAKDFPNPIPIKYVEIGNEMYFSPGYNIQAFPTGSTSAGTKWWYATAANYIANKLKIDFPGVITAAVASCVDAPSTNIRALKWNEHVVPFLNTNVDYVIMHSYVDVAAVEPFTETSFQNSIINWTDKHDVVFSNNSAGQYVFNQGWRTWVTEIRANGAVADTWGNSLLNVYSVIYMVGKGKASMFMQANLDAVVKPDKSLKPRALAMLPLFTAAQNANQLATLDFPGAPKLNGSTRAAVDGIVFKNISGDNRCIIMNMTANAQTIDLSSVYPVANTLTISGRKNTLNSVDDPEILTEVNYRTTGVVLQPFSVNFIRKP